MSISHGLRIGLCLALAVGFTLTPPLASTARAELIETETILAGDARERVRDAIARDDVAAQLAALGLSQDEAQRRVAALSDAELAGIAGKLEELPAGGAAVVVIVALVAVALAFTDWIGVTSIYPWVERRDPQRSY